jgi:hypothetical protein
MLEIDNYKIQNMILSERPLRLSEKYAGAIFNQQLKLLHFFGDFTLCESYNFAPCLVKAKAKARSYKTGKLKKKTIINKL